MDKETLGLDRAIGDHHYRAYIGPPGEYDLVSAMTFSLAVACGLRQHHSLLDIGCGSLRLGRLFIPYLNKDCYVGMEPNAWLVEDGLKYELGENLIEHRSPQFLYETDLSSLAEDRQFDFMIAQSIFSHTAPDLLNYWLGEATNRLSADGLLLATVIERGERLSGKWLGLP